MDQTSIITMLLMIVVIAPATYGLTKRSCRRAIAFELERDFEVKRNSLLDQARTLVRNDEGHAAPLHNEYLKRKIDGANEKMAKFSVTLQPYSDVRKEYFGI